MTVPFKVLHAFQKSTLPSLRHFHLDNLRRTSYNRAHLNKEAKPLHRIIVIRTDNVVRGQVRGLSGDRSRRISVNSCLASVSIFPLGNLHATHYTFSFPQQSSRCRQGSSVAVNRRENANRQRADQITSCDNFSSWLLK